MKNRLSLFILIILFVHCNKRADVKENLKLEGVLTLINPFAGDGIARPLAGKEIKVAYSPSDTNHFMYKIFTDNKGYFTLEGLERNKIYDLFYEDTISDIKYVAFAQRKPNVSTTTLNDTIWMQATYSKLLEKEETAKKDSIKVSAYGAKADGTTDDRLSIQSAIDAAAVKGGTVMLDKPGTFSIGITTEGGFARGLTMAANVSLLIPPGTTLALKKNVVVDNAPVSVVYVPAKATNVYIGWLGKGGKIDGNTSNQPGWTSGYGQSAGNFLISADAGFDGIVIEGITLTNSFSNSINLGGTHSYGNSRNAKLLNLYCENFGEGIQIIACDSVICENITHVMNETVVEGDALELAFCRYFNVTGCSTTTSTGLTIKKGGSGIDCYSSRYGSVSNFSIQGTVYGMQIETDFGDPANQPDNIYVSNGMIKGVNYAGFVLSGGRISVADVQILDCVFMGAVLSNAGTLAAYRFTDVVFSGNCQIIVQDNVSVTARHLSINSTAALSSLSIGNCVLDIVGLTVTRTITNAIIIVVIGTTPVGRVTDINAPANMIPIIPNDDGPPLNLSSFTVQVNAPI